MTVVRLGRWCARHRVTVLVAWAAVLVLGLAGGAAVFDAVSADGSAAPSMESMRAQALQEKASGAGTTILVLVRHLPVGPDGRTTATARDAVRAAAGRAVEGVGITRVVSPEQTWVRPRTQVEADVYTLARAVRQAADRARTLAVTARRSAAAAQDAAATARYLATRGRRAGSTVASARARTAGRQRAVARSSAGAADTARAAADARRLARTAAADAAAAAAAGRDASAAADAARAGDRRFEDTPLSALDVPLAAGRLPVVATPTPADVARSLRSRDGRAVVVLVQTSDLLPPPAEERSPREVRALFAPLTSALPGVTVQLGGEIVTDTELRAQTQEDTHLGELISLPISFVVLMLVFGGLGASSIPIAGALGSIGGSLLVLLAMRHFVDLDSIVVPVTTVCGLGLAIDYSLLMISRFREERANGLDIDEALDETMLTAGRTVAYSGLLVASSMTGLLLLQSTVYRVVAVAAVSVVTLALAASLTLAPALLSRVARTMRVPAEPTRIDGSLSRLVVRVQRRPVLVLGSVCAVLLILAAPMMSARFENGHVELLPRAFESRQTATVLDAEFAARSASPIQVVARTTPDELDRWAAALKGRPDVASVGSATRLGPRVSQLDVVPSGPSQGPQARGLVRGLRERAAAFPVLVGGDAALLVDMTDEVVHRGPWLLAWVAAGALVLMFLLTGSVIVPLKALLLNAITLMATGGALVLVFQQGFGADLLGIETTRSLEIQLPVLLFAFAFGLSTDYECFIMGRITELRREGLDDQRAVRVGLQHSGRVVTSAALLMTVVFVGFACGKMLALKELGLGLTLAVALDATLVRLLLVPATLAGLGRLNWWAPRPMRLLFARLGVSHAGSRAPLESQGLLRPLPVRTARLAALRPASGTTFLDAPGRVTAPPVPQPPMPAFPPPPAPRFLDDDLPTAEPVAGQHLDASRHHPLPTR